MGDTARARGPETWTDWHTRMDLVAQILRVVAGIVILAVAWTTDAVRGDRGLLTAYILLFFLPFAVLDHWGSQRFSGLAWKLFVEIGNALTIFTIAWIAPAARVAVLVGYLVLVVNTTILSGRVAGLRTGAITFPLVLAAEALAGERLLNPLDVAVYAFGVVFLAVMVDAVTSERREKSEHLERLHEALRAVGSSTDPAVTFQAVGEAARHAVGATAVEVVLGARRAADADGAEVVVVPLRRQAGDGPGGALVASFPPGRAPAPADVHLLEAFAEHVAGVVGRAVALEQERETGKRLAEANEQKRRFLEIVSHELRTPLAVNLGFLDLLAGRWTELADDQRRDMVDRAYRHAEQLGLLIDQIIDVVDLEDQITVVPEPADLAALLTHAIEHVTPQLDGHPLDVAAPLDVKVLGDPVAFDRVLGPVLRNAAKFSAPGSPIRIVTSNGGAEVTVSVEDDGPGIPPEWRERVFDLFTQVERSRPGAQGLGVGLALARRYAEMQGGRLWIDDSYRAGSRFCFSLTKAS